MQKGNYGGVSSKHGDATYCTTEDILRIKICQKKDGLKHLQEKYETGSKFGPKIHGNDSSVGSESTGKCEKEIIRVSGSFESGQGIPSPSNTVGPTNLSEGVTDQDVLQVDMFYKSQKTDVHVCSCLANLYFGKTVAGKAHWKFTTTGIPVLVLDTGEHQRTRKLQIVLAEKGTGFVLWKNSIDHLTGYEAPHANFHTLHLTTDHTRLAGLSFDDCNAAQEFYSSLVKLTSDPNDELFNISKSKKKKKSEKKKTKYKPPKKAEISQPCCFVHVTKLERQNSNGQSSISSPVGLEQRTESRGDSQLNVNLQDVSDLVGSKLTLTSDSTSSGISEDIRSCDL